MKSFYKLAQTAFSALLFVFSFDCQAQSQEQIKYKCAVEVGSIQDWETRVKMYDKCLGFKGYVRDGGGKDLFEQSIVTPAEKRRRQQESEKQYQQYEQDERQKQAQCDKKFGRKCRIQLRNGSIVTDGEGYLLNNPTSFGIVGGFFRRLRDDDPGVNECCRRDVLCAIPLRPGVEYHKDILWHLREYCGKTSNQESSSKPSNQTPAPSAPPPQQISKLDILKKNSNLVLECIVVSQIFRRSAEEQNADADLKKITSDLAGRYSDYGEQIFKITDALRAKGDEIGEQFRKLDKDAQVGQWQRCNQWQP